MVTRREFRVLVHWLLGFGESQTERCAEQQHLIIHSKGTPPADVRPKRHFITLFPPYCLLEPEDKISVNTQELILLLLGWLLGILSPAIVDAIKYRREAQHGRRAVLNELHDLSLVLSLASYKAAQAAGQIDRAYLEWVIARVNESTTKQDHSELLQAIRGMLSYSDEHIAAAHDAMTRNGQTTPILQSYSAPLLDSRVSALWTFDTDFQRGLFSIKRNLSVLDDTVAQINQYFRMTFDELSPGNRHIIDANMTQLYGNYAERTKIIVDQIKGLAGAEPN